MLDTSYPSCIFAKVNYLAHIHLSGRDPAILAGNYMADIMRLHEARALPEDLYAGVLLHRRIDSFTDEHEAHRAGTKLLHDAHGKYAPVLVDIYFDHLLQRHWSRYGEESLEMALDRTYHALGYYQHHFGVAGVAYVDRLLDRRWLLTAYADRAGLETTFMHLMKKVSRPEMLVGAVDTLIRLDEPLEQAFMRLYPALMAEARLMRSTFDIKREGEATAKDALDQ